MPWTVAPDCLSGRDKVVPAQLMAAVFEHHSADSDSAFAHVKPCAKPGAEHRMLQGNSAVPAEKPVEPQVRRVAH